MGKKNLINAFGWEGIIILKTFFNINVFITRVKINNKNKFSSKNGNALL